MSDRISLRGANEYRIQTASSGSDDADFVNNIDTLGKREVEIFVWLGAFAYSGTNKLKFELQHSDTTTAADYADVPAAEIDGGDGSTAGLLFEQSAAVTGEGVDRVFNYKGSKRYLRIGMDETGTTTGEIVAGARLGTPRHRPV